MEGVRKIARDLRARPRPATDEEVFNAAREYLQVLVLKLIFQSPFGASLSFMGGTCLRTCYDLKRYSEDLDFALDGAKKNYLFSALIAHLQKNFDLLGYKISTHSQEEKTVQKSFLRFSDLPEQLELKSLRRGQKLHIKIEVDTRPPSLAEEDRESHFVNRFHEIFPILKHTLPTLFAGKILAVLYRPYVRGRDYYDLIWYLNRKADFNLSYLNRGSKERQFHSRNEVWEALKTKVRDVKPALILQDIGRFLEDPSEVQWIRQYHDLFEQLIKSAI